MQVRQTVAPCWASATAQLGSTKQLKEESSRSGIMRCCDYTPIIARLLVLRSPKPQPQHDLLHHGCRHWTGDCVFPPHTRSLLHLLLPLLLLCVYINNTLLTQATRCLWASSSCCACPSTSCSTQQQSAQQQWWQSTGWQPSQALVCPLPPSQDRAAAKWA